LLVCIGDQEAVEDIIWERNEFILIVDAITDQTPHHHPWRVTDR
jgi:hypothetical protein